MNKRWMSKEDCVFHPDFDFVDDYFGEHDLDGQKRVATKWGNQRKKDNLRKDSEPCGCLKKRGGAAS